MSADLSFNINYLTDNERKSLQSVISGHPMWMTDPDDERSAYEAVNDAMYYVIRDFPCLAPNKQDLIEYVLKYWKSY